MSVQTAPLATPMPLHAWVYRCRVTNVIDGDTVDVVIDAGFRATRVERLRLLGVNTPERKGATRTAGDAAYVYVAAWLAEAQTKDGDWPLLVMTSKSDAFGRYLGMVWRISDPCCLNDDLMADGHAVLFNG